MPRDTRRALALAALLAGAPACFDDAAPADAGGGGGSPPELPLTSCPTRSMVALYPGMWPPDPYGPKPAATACVAARHDAIIVLGCPNDADGAASACQTKRADIAVSLRDAGYGRRFITTGAAAHNAYVEAETLKALLIDRGVPAGDVLTDTKAEHTDENIYYATEIMLAQGWTNAVVVSDDPGHLVLTALCDSNCCVDLGRLTLFELAVAGGATVLAGHYALFPWTPGISAAECAQIETPSKFMCVNLPTRRACKGRLQLGD